MLDLTGKVFGKLTALEVAGKNKRGMLWKCVCECGKTTQVVCSNLRNGHTQSCGCLKHRKFGDSKTWQGYKEISKRTWSDIRNKAESRNLDFVITIQEAWEKFESQGRCCALTGWPIGMSAPKGQYSLKTASLDRINSELGYSKTNIQWVHKDVNLMKSWFPNERFLEVCKAVAANH